MKQKPTASSKSFPGVRMVTASASGSCPGPCTRISIGSSVTSLSGRSSTRPWSSACTRTDVVGRRTGPRVTVARYPGSSIPKRAASAGVSTSTNASGAATACHVASPQLVELDHVEERPQGTHAADHETLGGEQRVTAVARARDLQVAVIARDDRRLAGPVAQELEQ